MSTETLHVYFNDEAWVVASSPQEAKMTYMRETGTTNGEAGEFDLVSDETPLKMDCHMDHGGRVKTARQWADERGRGCLGTIDW